MRRRVRNSTRDRGGEPIQLTEGGLPSVLPGRAGGALSKRRGNRIFRDSCRLKSFFGTLPTMRWSPGESRGGRDDRSLLGASAEEARSIADQVSDAEASAHR
jgi:hypothetical protein